MACGSDWRSATGRAFPRGMPLVLVLGVSWALLWWVGWFVESVGLLVAGEVVRGIWQGLKNKVILLGRVQVESQPPPGS